MPAEAVRSVNLSFALLISESMGSVPILTILGGCSVKLALSIVRRLFASRSKVFKILSGISTGTTLLAGSVYATPLMV